MSNYRHGHARPGAETPEYRTYKGMLQRCYYQKHNRYEKYGGRGIKVCERWLESFGNFLADMGPRPKGHSLDRRDVDGDYSPDNCRWATPREQGTNTARKPRPNSPRVGVNLHRGKGKYQASIGVCGKLIYLGATESAEDAVTLRKGAELKYYGKVLP